MNILYKAWLHAWVYMCSVKLVYTTAKALGEPWWVCLGAALYQATTRNIVQVTIEFKNGNRSAREESDGT